MINKYAITMLLAYARTLDEEKILTFPVTHIHCICTYVKMLQNNLPLVGQHSDIPLDQQVRCFLLLTNLLVVVKEASVKTVV